MSRSEPRPPSEVTSSGPHELTKYGPKPSANYQNTQVYGVVCTCGWQRERYTQLAIDSAMARHQAQFAPIKGLDLASLDQTITDLRAEYLRAVDLGYDDDHDDHHDSSHFTRMIGEELEALGQVNPKSSAAKAGLLAIGVYALAALRATARRIKRDQADFVRCQQEYERRNTRGR